MMLVEARRVTAALFAEQDAICLSDLNQINDDHDIWILGGGGMPAGTVSAGQFPQGKPALVVLMDLTDEAEVNRLKALLPKVEV